MDNSRVASRLRARLQRRKKGPRRRSEDRVPRLQATTMMSTTTSMTMSMMTSMVTTMMRKSKKTLQLIMETKTGILRSMEAALVRRAARFRKRRKRSKILPPRSQKAPCSSSLAFLRSRRQQILNLDSGTPSLPRQSRCWTSCARSTPSSISTARETYGS